MKINSDLLTRRNLNDFRSRIILSDLIIASGDSQLNKIPEPDSVQTANKAVQGRYIAKIGSGEKDARNVSGTPSGRFPWLDLVRRNSPKSGPVVIGFYQDEAGQVKTLYGKREFKSKRQVKGGFLFSFDDKKRVKLLSTDFLKVDAPSVKKSNLWNQLPKDLRERFENGEILVTGVEDLYKSSTPHRSSSKARTGSPEQEYFLLYYSDSKNEMGRTGVLMTCSDGKFEPILVKIEDREYIIELKGCGQAKGGFGEDHFRTGRDIVTGGAEAEQANVEFDVLSKEKGEGPKIAGAITFKHQNKDAGYIVRLSPSTVRASFTGDAVYPNIESPELVNEVLDMYTSLLVEHAFGANPKIMDRSYHTENILVWGDGNFTFTDYSDHAEFAAKDIPHNSGNTGYITHKALLEHYIDCVKEIPGYSNDKRSDFYQKLQKAFKDKSIDIVLDESMSPKEVAQTIFESAIAIEVFKARRKEAYLPSKIQDECKEKLRINGMETLESLKAKFQKAHEALAEFKTLAKTTKIEDKDLERLSKFDLNDQSLTYKALSEELEFIFEILKTGTNNLEGEDIKSKFSSLFWSFANYVMQLNPIDKYLDSEEELIRASQKAQKKNGLENELSKALDEIKAKRKAMIEVFHRGPQDLHELLTNTEKFNKFIAMTCYK